MGVVGGILSSIPQHLQFYTQFFLQGLQAWWAAGPRRGARTGLQAQTGPERGTRPGGRRAHGAPRSADRGLVLGLG
jgi:hypothetical protein